MRNKDFKNSWKEDNYNQKEYQKKNEYYDDNIKQGQKRRGIDL